MCPLTNDWQTQSRCRQICGQHAPFGAFVSGTLIAKQTAPLLSFCACSERKRAKLFLIALRPFRDAPIGPIRVLLRCASKLSAFGQKSVPGCDLSSISSSSDLCPLNSRRHMKSVDRFGFSFERLDFQGRCCTHRGFPWHSGVTLGRFGHYYSVEYSVRKVRIPRAQKPSAGRCLHSDASPGPRAALECISVMRSAAVAV
jgi:hypothetical protein